MVQKRYFSISQEQGGYAVFPVAMSAEQCQFAAATIASEEKKHAESADDSRGHLSDPLRRSIGVASQCSAMEWGCETWRRGEDRDPGRGRRL
jgi:hypothetical protein